MTMTIRNFETLTCRVVRIDSHLSGWFNIIIQQVDAPYDVFTVVTDTVNFSVGEIVDADVEHYSTKATNLRLYNPA